MASKTPSDEQLKILQVLWEHQPATVRFVHEQLSQEKEVRYTTTLKQMQRMTEDGLIKRKKLGKSHEYMALLGESQVKKSLVNRLKDTVFKGSAMEMIMHALGQEKPSQEELEDLKKWLDDKKGSKS